jgi:hypothetical protein
MSFPTLNALYFDKYIVAKSYSKRKRLTELACIGGGGTLKLFVGGIT